MGSKKCVSDIPQLVLEWDHQKNSAVGLCPEKLLEGSNKKAWWICSVCGHEWEAQIQKRAIRLQGCPICGKRKMAEKQEKNRYKKLSNVGSLADNYPNLMIEWDYEKNLKTPFDYLSHSNQSAFWICSKCGYKWEARIAARSKGHGCKRCGQENAKRTLLTNLIAEHGSLAENNPELASEWHPTKNNDLTAADVMVNTNRAVWWKCKKCGFEWKAAVCNRNSGKGCRRCLAAAMKLSQSTPIAGVNDLESQRPDLAAEWHPTKNGELTPRDITRSANRKVWWLGKCGHEWQSVVGSRYLGRGCPVCVKEFKISYPEKALFFYVKKYLSNFSVKENFKPEWLHGKEIDIYVPELRFGIEYDGVAWHKDADVDNEKDSLCQLHQIDLLRIREKGSPVLKSRNIFWVENCSENEKILTTAIKYVFDYLLQQYNIYQEIEISLDRDRVEIYNLLEIQKKENSLATLYPEVAKEWHPTKNGYLTPEHISAHTHKAFWWQCDAGHEYSMIVKYKTEEGCQCPICSSHRVLKGFNDLGTKRPDIAAEWHPTKNLPLTPADVMEYSNKKVWWKCPADHDYLYSISHRTAKEQKCPICSGRRLCVGTNDLCTVNSQIAKEWYYEKNNGLRPEQFTSISGKRVWWKCSVCGHEWDIKISDRFIKGHGCQKCAGFKRVETRRKKAIASKVISD